MICELCAHDLDDSGDCQSCILYNAAVAAQKAAAVSIARARGCDDPGSAWLNEYGVLGWRDGACDFIGTADEAAPFAKLTTEAREVYYRRAVEREP